MDKKYWKKTKKDWEAIYKEILTREVKIKKQKIQNSQQQRLLNIAADRALSPVYDILQAEFEADCRDLLNRAEGYNAAVTNLMGSLGAVGPGENLSKFKVKLFSD